MPVPAAGTFTASALFASLEMSDRVWSDNMARPDYEAQVDIVRAIQAEQTANIEPFDGDKDQSVKVWWTNACNVVVEDCSNDCVIGGAELSTDSKTYTLDLCKRVGFQFKEKAMRTNSITREEQLAKGTLKASKALDEWIAQTLVAKIESYEGTNSYIAPGWTWDAANKHTVVPGGTFNVSLIPHLILAGTMNRFSNPFILSGRNLFIADWEAMYNGANADGRGEQARFQAIRKYYDLFNIDVVNAPNLKTYLLNRGAVAMTSRSYHPAVPVQYFHATHYSIESRNIPGVRYDVFYTNSCANDEITHKFTFKFTGGIYLNPTGCDETRTGVLTFMNDGGAAAI